jgi:uncharacterized protein YbaP (TraB family)
VLRAASAKLAVPLVALAAILACPTATARDRHALWTVEGRHNTVYLLGSIHVLRPNDGGLPDVAEDAYDDAERIVMEIDLDDPAVVDPMTLLGQMQRTALLPEGETLRGVLGADYDIVQAQLQAAGLDLAMLDRFAPWFVATMLLQLELTKAGFRPEFGVEQRIATRAREDGKPITGLETPEQQFAVLANLSLPDQKRFLLLTLEDFDQLESEAQELLTAWRSGDTGKLEAILTEQFEEFPELYGPLTEDRNRAWVGGLTDLLDDRDDYLVVVGAAHLVGRNSVVDLLRERGYEVEQR